MRYGINNPLNFAIGLTLSVFGASIFFKTDSLIIMIISVFLTILGLFQLGKSSLNISK